MEGQPGVLRVGEMSGVGTMPWVIVLVPES
jgi:hypothetical protein